MVPADEIAFDVGDELVEEAGRVAAAIELGPRQQLRSRRLVAAACGLRRAFDWLIGRYFHRIYSEPV